MPLQLLRQPQSAPRPAPPPPQVVQLAQRAAGTPVTQESYDAWFERFSKETGPKEGAAVSVGERRLTGREWFTQRREAGDGDGEEGGEAAGEGEESDEAEEEEWEEEEEEEEGEGGPSDDDEEAVLAAYG